MTRALPHLYTRQDDIARMEAMILQLPDGAMVELRLAGGGSITGTVAVRPGMQVFRDADGQRPQVAHCLWLDRIASVTALGPA